MTDTQKMQLVSAILCQQTEISKPTPDAPATRSMGQNIVVLNRGWVYVGDVTLEGDFMRIANASCIRKWGTERGLGELRDGPAKSTVLDPAGTVLARFGSVIHLIPCKGF